jgi:hypothetical protein
MYFSAFRKFVRVFGQTAGVLGFAATLACSSDEEPSPGSGGQSGSGGSSGASSAGGGSTAAGTNLGSFSVTLEAANGDKAPSTSVLGKVYSGPYPQEVIETPVVSGGGCTAYKYSLQACIEVECSSSQRCAGPEECRDLPRLVGVGAVSVTGFDAGPMTLTAVSNNYQFAGNIPYPGLADGAALTLTAAGDHYPAFTITSTGIAPMVLRADSYSLSEGGTFLIEWEPGQNSAARVSIVLNLTRHGGSAGYLECDAPDSGSLTIPANVLQALVDLGVAGFPQLVAKRYTRGVAAVPGGHIALNVSAVALPKLNVEGVCSCNDSGDCGSCSDTTKTSCDAEHRLCVAP